MYKKIEAFIDSLKIESISQERKFILQELINYIDKNASQMEVVQLNLICTHNSRRSQFSQVWTQVAAYYYGVKTKSYSGGIEVTECNERTIKSLSRFGFKIQKNGSINPVYEVAFDDSNTIALFSKLYNNDVNPIEGFASVMTCSHADDNCPFIPGSTQRIPLMYKDPKAFDNTPLESEKYDERSREIATELFYVFSQVKIK